MSHLRDTLVLRDFVMDVKSMLSQQVWEDVPPPPRSDLGLAVAGTALAAGLETQRKNIGAALQGTVSWLTPGARRSGQETNVGEETKMEDVIHDTTNSRDDDDSTALNVCWESTDRILDPDTGLDDVQV
jgi:hypothetical protein